MMRRPNKRPFVEPAQMLPKRCDRTDDEDRRRLELPDGSICHDRLECPVDGLLVRCRAVVDDRRRLVCGAAVGDELANDACQLPRARVADDRAAEPGQTGPVDLGRLVGLRLVAAHEYERVAGAGIGHRDSGVAWRANGRGDAGDDFEGHALLVQEHRLASAAVEHVRIAPLEPHDRFALSRFFRQEEADRVLLHRLRRGRADIDPFRFRPRGAQQACVDEMVVDDDVSRLERAQTTHADEAGVARSGTDDGNFRTHC